MKTTFKLLSGILAVTTGAAFALSSVPDSFPTGGGSPEGDGNNVVVIYEGNQIGLAAGLPEAIAEQIADQPIDDELIQQLMAGITPPITAQKIANALSAFIASNPANAVKATAMAVVIANRANLTVQNKVSIIAAAVQTLARQGNTSIPAISTLIGFAAQLSPAGERPAVISDLRNIAVASLPMGSPVERALALDSVLVQNNILTATSIPAESMPILMARANQQNMIVQLVTPFSSFETETGQIANSATTGGTGFGANPFASGGAIDTPDNPAGINNPVIPSIPPGPTPTPTPTPTPPGPYGA